MYFSESMLSFIPVAWKTDGTYSAEAWPTDAVLLTEAERVTYYGTQGPAGKALGAENGRPVWVAVVVSVQVPQKVTMRQARLALHNAGRLTSVETAIDALPEPPRTAARIEWDFSSEVYRHKEFVSMLALTLNLSDDDLDELFLQAELL
jgi:hypothetical protein